MKHGKHSSLQVSLENTNTEQQGKYKGISHKI